MIKEMMLKFICTHHDLIGTPRKELTWSCVWCHDTFCANAYSFFFTPYSVAYYIIIVFCDSVQQQNHQLPTASQVSPSVHEKGKRVSHSIKPIKQLFFSFILRMFFRGVPVI